MIRKGYIILIAVMIAALGMDAQVIPITNVGTNTGVTYLKGRNVLDSTIEFPLYCDTPTKAKPRRVGNTIRVVSVGDTLCTGDTTLWQYNFGKWNPAFDGINTYRKMYYVPNYVQSGDTAYDQALRRAIVDAWNHNWDGDVVIEPGIHELKDSVIIFSPAAYDSSVIYHPYCIVPVPQSLPNSPKSGRMVIRALNPIRYVINKDSAVDYSVSSALRSKRNGHPALSNGRAYIIGHSGDNLNQPNATGLTVSDLVFITLSGAGIGAVSGQNGTSTYVYNCIATRDTAMPYMADVSGLEGNDAFCFRQFNYRDVNNYVDNVTAIGYHNAVSGGCGFTAGTIRAFGCYNGYMAHRSCATQYVNNLISGSCVNAVGTIETGSHLTDTCHFKINNLTVIAGTDSAKWYYTRYGLYDKYDNGVGTIASYNYYYNGIRRNDYFYKYQGTDVSTYPLNYESEPKITAGVSPSFYAWDKTFRNIVVSNITGLQDSLNTRAYTSSLDNKLTKGGDVITSALDIGGLSGAFNVSLIQAGNRKIQLINSTGQIRNGEITMKPTDDMVADFRGRSSSYIAIKTTGTGVLVTDGLWIGEDTITNKAVIRQKENADLGIYTNNTERITVFANGNIALGIETQQSNTVATTDATPTTIATIPLSTSGARMRITASVGGVSSTNDVAGIKTATFRNNAGTVSVLVAPSDIASTVSDAGLATASFTFVVSGTNVLVQVTGVAATNINWTSLTKYITY